MAVRIITVRGIGEALDYNLLSQVTRHFPNTEHVELEWDAVYGPVGGRWDGIPFGKATSWGEVLLEKELDKGPALVVGYSGGAEVAGNVAQKGHKNIVATGLVSDPSAPEFWSGHGIKGRRPTTLPQPARWESNRLDVICSAPKDSPLRAFAEVSEGFSLGDPEYWGHDLLQKINTDRFWEAMKHPLSVWNVWNRYETAYRDVCGYLGVRPENPSRIGVNHHTNYKLDDLAWWLATKKKDYEFVHGI